jgi:hypothetical protein
VADSVLDHADENAANQGTLLSRLERLEVRTAAFSQVQVRFREAPGLPIGYKGERHIVVTKQLPSQNGQEWVEFEEVPGPDPNPPELAEHKRGVPTLISVMFV